MSVAVASCGSYRNIVGKYSRPNGNLLSGGISVTLNNDSTFYSFFRGGWHKSVSSGTWHIGEKRNQLVLHSYVQDIKNIPVIVRESKVDNRVYSIIIFDNHFKFLDALVNWTLNVNGVDYLINNDSLILQSGVIVENFYIQGYHRYAETVLPIPHRKIIQSERYYVKNTNNNVFYIAFPEFVDDDIFYYEIITNETLLIRRNSLLWNWNRGSGKIRLRRFQ